MTQAETRAEMLRIALWELCFGGGDGAMWERKIRELRGDDGEPASEPA